MDRHDILRAAGTVAGRFFVAVVKTIVACIATAAIFLAGLEWIINHG